MARFTTLLLIFFIVLSTPAQAFNFDRALKNYNAIISGRAQIGELSPKEQTEVYTLAQMIERQSCDGPPDCCDAMDEADSAASDLEDAASEMTSCAENRDYDDGCYSEYSDIESAYDDYENAVSSVDSECE